MACGAALLCLTFDLAGDFFLPALDSGSPFFSLSLPPPFTGTKSRALHPADDPIVAFMEASAEDTESNSRLSPGAGELGPGPSDRLSTKWWAVGGLGSLSLRPGFPAGSRI